MIADEILATVEGDVPVEPEGTASPVLVDGPGGDEAKDPGEPDSVEEGVEPKEAVEAVTEEEDDEDLRDLLEALEDS